MSRARDRAMRRAVLTVLGTGMLLSFGSSSATAAGFISVSTTSDTVADGGNCSLREAITSANTDTASGATPGECAAGDGPDTISVPDGTYLLGSGLSVTSDIDVVGASQASTIIDGQDS